MVSVERLSLLSDTTLGMRRTQQAIRLAGDYVIAFTAGRFQPGTVEYVDETALIPDQPLVLELARHVRHTGPPHAQHAREKFLRQRQLGAPDAVLRLQEPAGAARPDWVQAVTGRVLAELRAPRLGIACQHADELTPALRHGLVKHLHGHSERRPRHLDERRKGHTVRMQKPWQPHHAFIADGAHFERGAIGERADHGHDRIQRKVKSADGLTARNERLPEPQRHGLEREEQRVDRGRRERPKQPVLLEKRLRWRDSHGRLLNEKHDGTDRRQRVLDRLIHRVHCSHRAYACCRRRGTVTVVCFASPLGSHTPARLPVPGRSAALCWHGVLPGRTVPRTQRGPD